MKRNLWILALFFIMSSFSPKLVAQENLNALVRKCETMTSVCMNFIREKNSQTKRIETKMINISIKDNQVLINDFLVAFKKDEENALSIVENKQGEEMVSLFYKFENVTYTFSFSEKNSTCTNEEKEKGGCASVNVLY